MKHVIILIGTFAVACYSHCMETKRDFNFKAFFEKRDSTGKTYLHHAIKGGNAKKWQSGDLNDEVPSTEYLNNILATNAQLISYIIRAGTYVNILDKKRRTPLFYAAKYKNLPAVKLLLEAGADPNIRNKEGIPPLVIACSIENNAPIITALLEGGARFRDLSERVPPRLASSFESESERETILESALKTCPVNALALLQYHPPTCLASPLAKASDFAKATSDKSGDRSLAYSGGHEEESSEWSSFSDEESPNVVGTATRRSKPTGQKKGSSFGTPSYSFIEKLSYVLY